MQRPASRSPHTKNLPAVAPDCTRTMTDAILQAFPALKPQVDEANRFWRSKQIRTALIVPWAEAFTGAFQGPVYAFFMQNLGLTPAQMGVLRATQIALNAASAPIVGWLLDRHGPWLGIALPSAACSIGCAVRAAATGFSTLEVGAVFSGLSGAKIDMALAHLSRHTSPPRRTLAVSAAKVQIQALTLLGTLCFTPFDSVLRWLLPSGTFGMLRFRIEVALCTIGCGFGVIVLLLFKDVMSYDAAHTAPGADGGGGLGSGSGGGGGIKAEDEEEALDPAERAPVCPSPSASPPAGVEGDAGRRGGATFPAASGSLPASPGSSSDATGVEAASAAALEGSSVREGPLQVLSGQPVGALDVLRTSIRELCPCAESQLRGGSAAVLIFALCALFFSAFFRDLLRITWPLFIKAHFGWTEREYGLLLPFNQGLAFCLVFSPWLHERLGSASAVCLLGGVSALFYALAFTLQEATPLSEALHVGGVLLADLCNSAFEIILIAISSTFAPPDAQGRLFALLALVRYAGSILANLAGTSLYQTSLGWQGVPPLLGGGGALPTSLLALPALINVAALTSTLYARSAAGNLKHSRASEFI